MIAYKLSLQNIPIRATIRLPASKSESNRVLIIKALCEKEFKIKNLSKANDTVVLQRAFTELDNNGELDIESAGTAFRFLTAYLSLQPGNYSLTGSERIKNRPIRELVRALQKLGADIQYMENEGFAPLKIKGGSLKGGEVNINGNVSSQFISALMLIGPHLIGGLKINISGRLVSKPYVTMTAKLMRHFGVEVDWKNETISIAEGKYNIDKLPKDEEGTPYYEIESDWTAASYWYAITALGKGATITLEGLKQSSIQGDSILPALFYFFGVKTEYTNEGIVLTHNGHVEERFGFDFSDNPDLAQTVAVVASALKIPCLLNGLETLRVKETDRIEALKAELEKIGADVTINDEGSIYITPPSQLITTQHVFSTYEDHRMAMALAPLALITDEISIENPKVVCKSYPAFWEDLLDAGYRIEELMTANENY